MSALPENPEFTAPPLVPAEVAVLENCHTELRDPGCGLPSSFWRAAVRHEKQIFAASEIQYSEVHPQLSAERTWTAKSHSIDDDFDRTAYSAWRNLSRLPLVGIWNCTLIRYRDSDVASGRPAESMVYELRLAPAIKRLRVYPMLARITEETLTVSTRHQQDAPRKRAKSFGSFLKPTADDARTVMEQLAFGAADAKRR